MRAGQGLAELHARLCLRLTREFDQKRPTAVLVHGDTATCFAAVVSCFYLKIPVYHVEAGLRSYQLDSPFPEEFHRQVASPIVAHHYAPTELEKAQLIKEGVESSRITVTGATGKDAVQFALCQQARRDREAVEKAAEKRQGEEKPTKTVCVTLHRREAPLVETMQVLKKLAEQFSSTHFVFPMHPSPRVRQLARQHLSGLSNFQLMEPMDYPRFVRLIQKADLIVTDSGGIQEEASLLKTPVYLVREATERQDGLKEGTVKLLGSDPQRIFKTLKRALLASEKAETPRFGGDPSPSGLIADHLARVLA